MILFNSFEFAIFFSLVYCIYLMSNHHWQNRWLLFASYIFYGSWNWKFLSLIWTSTIIDYYCGLKIFESRSQKRRKAYLLFSMASNLGILGFFKYFNFFADTFNGLLVSFGLHPSLPLLNIILPIGISFYTFQSMGYTLDVYREKSKPCTHFFIKHVLAIGLCIVPTSS